METIEHAINYSSHGWPVFPAHTIHDGKCTCNRCCRSPGKHPKIRGGFKAASTNVVNLNSWFTQPANIGIATGKPSELVVLDIDKKNGGFESLMKLEKKFGSLSDKTLVANTGGGGLHLYFSYNKNKVRSRPNVLGSGIDIRADGGYVIASPSNHISGINYSWRDGFYLPSELPTDIEQELQKNPALNGYATNSTIREGQRNQSLFQFAAKLRAKGNESDQIEYELLQRNSALCSTPLPQDEVIAIVNSACRYKKGNAQLPLKTYWHELIYSESSGLKSNVRNTLTALSFFMDEDGANAHPSMELLGKRAGCHRQAIASNLRMAESDGWIKSFKVPNQTTQGCHYGYIATIPPTIT